MPEDITLLGVLFSWFPALALIGFWVYFMRKIGCIPTTGKMTGSQFLEELTKETKRRNAAVEKLLARTEERLIRLDTPAGQNRANLTPDS